MLPEGPPRTLLTASDSLNRARSSSTMAWRSWRESAVAGHQGLRPVALVNQSVGPAEQHLDEAAACADKALGRDPDCYLAILARGLVAAKRGDLERALPDLRRAAESSLETAQYSPSSDVMRLPPGKSCASGFGNRSRTCHEWTRSRRRSVCPLPAGTSAPAAWRAPLGRHGRSSSCAKGRPGEVLCRLAPPDGG